MQLCLNPRRVQGGRSAALSLRRKEVVVVGGWGRKEEVCWTEPVVVTIRGNFVFRSKAGADEGHGRCVAPFCRLNVHAVVSIARCSCARSYCERVWFGSLSGRWRNARLEFCSLFLIAITKNFSPSWLIEIFFEYVAVVNFFIQAGIFAKVL